MASPLSLRGRLLVLALASILLTLFVAGASLVFMFERQVLRYVEQELETRWTELAGAFALDEEGTPSLTRPLTDPRYQKPYGGAYWQVASDSAPLLRSRSLWDGSLDSRAISAAGKARAFELDGPSGAELYVIERDVKVESPSGTKTFGLSVALDHAQVTQLRSAFGWDVAKILAPLALMLVGASYAQFRISMRPLRALAAELNAIRGGTALRIAHRYPPELSPFVDSLNLLLDRQDDLVRKARDRAGSLAHGLKTPLTILAGEVRRLEQRGLLEAAARIQEQLGAFSRHVDRELARARTSGASVACEAHTDVELATNRLVRLMDRLPRGSDLVWHTEIPEGLAVRMEPDDFAEVLGNLLDNGRKWARSIVRVRAEAIGERVVIVVEDDGPGFAPGTLERGVSHHDEPGSAGLGLAIAKDVLAEYGAVLAIDAASPCRVTFELARQRRSESGGADGRHLLSESAAGESA